MFVISGLNTVFPSAFSVMVITAATIEESLLEGEGALVATAIGKMDPIAFSPIVIVASAKITAIKSDNDTYFPLFLECRLSISKS